MSDSNINPDNTGSVKSELLLDSYKSPSMNRRAKQINQSDKWFSTEGSNRDFKGTVYSDNEGDNYAKASEFIEEKYKQQIDRLSFTDHQDRLRSTSDFNSSMSSEIGEKKIEDLQHSELISKSVGAGLFEFKTIYPRSCC